MELGQAAVGRIEDDQRLDAAIDAAAGPVRALAESPAGGSLRGEWLGHPLHPMLTDIPIGCWTSAMILDLVGGAKSRFGAQRLIGLGLVSMVPTAMAGAVDWASIDEQKSRRVGFVHAASNSVAGVLYLLSWNARRRGRHSQGVALGMAGGAVATIGGFLGGHLAFGSSDDDS
jgi:uncharacterized membrane protein